MNSGAWRWHVGAAVLYAAAALLFIDRGLPFDRGILGLGPDPQQFIWFLAWWPFAISHHLNPFFSAYDWQPAGVNLCWMTSVPLLALLAMPVTWAGGPMLAYNILIIAAPALAALGAYALCLYITRQPPASILGGYLFGFSAYEMAQSLSHLNLSFTVFVPLLLLVGLARLDGVLPRRRAVLWVVVLLAAQFGVSVEIFATEVFFGGIAWALAWACYPARRMVLNRLANDSLYATPVLVVVLAPVLWIMFGWPHHFAVPSGWVEGFSTDLLNLVVPTITTKLGGLLMVPLTRHFTGFALEQDAYLGVLLLGIVIAFCARHNRFFGLLFGVILLLSLGPFFRAGGVATGVPLPWQMAERLPLLRAALPARFMIYESLLAAVIAALWVAECPAGKQRSRRMQLAALACLLLLPSLYPDQGDPRLKFFVPGRVQEVLGARPKLLILPFGMAGNSSFWQAQSQFAFTQTGGYLGAPDVSLQTDVPMLTLYEGDDVPDLAPDLAAYCRHTGTDFVVATSHTSPVIMAAVKSLGWPARRVDDVTVFTVPHE
jgi:hypothetical protein